MAYERPSIFFPLLKTDSMIPYNELGNDGVQYTQTQRNNMLMDLLTGLNPDKKDIFTRDIATKNMPGGDAIKIADELRKAGVQFGNKAEADNETQIIRFADDLARYGVKSLTDLRAEKIVLTKKGSARDLFYDSRTGKLIPQEFGSDTRGKGRTAFALDNINGAVAPRASWEGTSNWSDIRGAAKVAAVIGGAAAIDMVVYGSIGGGMAAASGAAGATTTAAAGAEVLKTATTPGFTIGGKTVATVGGAIKSATDIIKSGGEIITSAGAIAGTVSALKRLGANNNAPEMIAVESPAKSIGDKIDISGESGSAGNANVNDSVGVVKNSTLLLIMAVVGGIFLAK